MSISAWDSPYLNVWGIANTFGHDDDGRLVLRQAVDVEPIIDNNKRLQNQGNNGFGPSREVRQVASVPLVEWMNLRSLAMKLHGVDINRREGDKVLRSLLRDSDRRFLKTASGGI